MTRSIRTFVLAVSLVFPLAACHPGPVLTGHEQVGGTIAGVVHASGDAVRLDGRKVKAIDVATGQQFEATTGLTGGYTIKVPKGHYRLQVETRTGEIVAKEPGEIDINNGDLDAGRDFDLTVS